MSENFTAEDFARANFATRGEFEVARRVDPDDALAWRACQDDGREVFLTDDGMSRDGWVPVVESRVMEHTLWDLQAAAERKRQRLLDHIADQDRVIRRRNDEIAALRRELADAQAPLSLDVLSDAWEAAEVPAAGNPAREGDVVIVRNDSGIGGYFVRPSHETHDFEPEAEGSLRILSRAPREPWADLADELAEVLDADARYSDGLARDLHNRGWRKGGDES